MSGEIATALYRLFGDDDALLYIGIAKYFGRRWHQHAHAQPWWPEVKRQTVDWYPSRAEALKAETAAIRAEFPRYNVVHNGPRPEVAEVPVTLTPSPPPVVLPSGPQPLPEWALAEHLGISEEELGRLPVTVTVKGAAKLLGLGQGNAYRLAAAGEFPCRVIAVGDRTTVPVFALLKTPGVTVNVDELRALVLPRAAA